MEEKSGSGSPSMLKSEQQKAKAFLLKVIALFTSTQYVELCKYLAGEQNVFFTNVNSVLLSNDANIISTKKALIDLIEDKILSSNYMRTAIEPVVMAFKAGLQELLAGFYLRNINESTSIIDAINISTKVSKYACQALKLCLKINDKNSSLRLENFLIQVEDQLFKKLLAQTPEEDLFNKILAAFDFKAGDSDADVEVINKIATVDNVLRLKYLEISKDDLNEKLISAYIDPKFSKLTSVIYQKFYQEFSRLIAIVSDDKDKQVFRAWQTELKQITEECKPVGELKKLFTTISDFASSRGTLNLQSLIELLKRFMPCYQMHVSLTQSILHKAYEEALYKPNTSTLLKLEHQLPFHQATIFKYLEIIRNQVPAFMRDNSLPLNGSHLSSEEWSAAVFQAQAEYTRSFCRLLNRIAYGVELLLGLDSTQEITLSLLGSAANNSLTPYSDVEYALITQKSYAAVQCFTSLFNYQINKLGEWSEDKNGNILHEGFCVDPGANPAVDPRLVASAAVLPSQFNKDEDARWRLHDGMAYALFNPLVVYSFSPETENILIQQYQDANKLNQQSVVPLAELPKLASGQCVYHGIDRDLPLHKACALAYLERDLHGYCEESASDAVGTHFPDFAGVNGKYKPLGESFCAKKRLVKPLSYILLDLALYTGLSTRTIEGAIESLCSAKDNIPAKLAAHLKEELRLAIAQLTAIRYRQQYFYKKQRELETLVIPAAANKPEYKDCYILNDEEWKIIQSIETRLVWPFYQILVTGLLKRNSVVQLDQFKDLDPAIYLMEELLAQVKDYYRLEKKSEIDEQLAKNIIASYILTLIGRKASYAQHQRTYDELPAILQQHYCHYLQQYDNSVEAASIINKWQIKLVWFPKPNGERLIVQQKKEQWESACNKLIISFVQWKEMIVKSPYVGKKLPLLFVRRVVQGKVIDSAFHPEAVIYLLNKSVINEDGLFQPRNKHAASLKEIKGQHLVVPIDVTIDNIRIRVHLKFFPELPGMEYAAGSLSRLLVGYGSPFSELVRLEFINVKLPIPLLIMETIAGDDLDAHAKISPNIENLQSEFFSKAVLQAIAFNREDGKGDNTYLAPCPLNPTQLSLVLIDSDRCFFPAVGRDEKGRLIPFVKEIIFCLQQMLDKTDLSTARELLALDLHMLLKHWLIDCLQIESEKIGQLFSIPEKKVLFPKEAQTSGVVVLIKKLVNSEEEFITSSILPLSFLENDIGPLYKKLHKIQSVLRQKLDRSHLELLIIAEPMLGQYYQQLLKLKNLSVKERFAKGFVSTGLYQQTKTGRQLSRMPSQQILQTAKGREIKITDLLDKPNRFKEEIIDELEKSVKQTAALSSFKANANSLTSIDKIIQFLHDDPDGAILDEVNFKDINDTQVFLKKLLTIPTNFRYLRLLNCKGLTSDLLNQIRKQFPSLQILNISGCAQLQVSDLRSLALSPGLIKLIANRHTQLQELRLEAPLFSGGLFVETYFSYLQYLELNECINLHTLICKTPDLISIKLKDNKKLQKLQIKAKELKIIDLRGCALEGDEKFLVKFSKIHERLTEIRVVKNEITGNILKEAIKRNDIGLVLAFLFNQNFHTKEVMSWCHNENRWEAIQYLIEKNPILIDYSDVSDRDTILMRAIKAGKQEMVVWLLSLKVDVMIQNKNGETAFGFACAKGDLLLAKRLYAYDVRVLNQGHMTGLIAAAKAGKYEIVAWLLDLKADVMIQNKSGETVFSFACAKGDLALAKRLYTCDARLLNHGRMTGLMTAAEAGKQEVVAWLLDLKADVMIQNNEGETAFSLACEQGHLLIAEKFFEINKTVMNLQYGEYSWEKRTPLMQAVKSDKKEVIEFLLRLKADVTVQNENGETAFSFACAKGDLELAKRLYTCDARVINHEQLAAVSYGNQEILTWLLDLNADVMIQNKNGETAFSFACEQGDLLIAEQIFEKNETVLNLQYGKYPWNSKTPLMQAVKLGKEEVIEFLLRLKADVMIQNKNGETAFSIACDKGDLMLAKRLYACDARLLNHGSITGLMAAVKAGKQEIVSWLLDLKADVMIQSENGETVFSFACASGDLVLAKRLYACDVRMLNYGPMTGLMAAAQAGKQEVVAWLLDLKADLMIQNDHGETAFSLACGKSDLALAKRLYAYDTRVLNHGRMTGLMAAAKAGRQEVVSWLLDIKADVMIKNKSGETAFSLACEEGYLLIAEQIFEQNETVLNLQYGRYIWDKGTTPLMQAVKSGKEKTTEFLLHLEADVMIQSNDGETAFTLACAQGDLVLAKQLYACDARILNHGRITGLMAAAEAGKLEIVAWLLDLKADMLIQNSNGETVFSLACTKGDLALAKRLYAYDARLLNHGPMTGLMAAAKAGKQEVVAWLLDLKADVMIKNDLGETAFSLACEQEHLLIAEQIFEKNKDVVDVEYGEYSPLMQALKSGKEKITEFLLRLEADVMIEDEDGGTAFHWACHGGNLACTKLIYQNNPEFFYQEDDDGRTGFHVACERGHLEVVKWSLEQDVNKTLLNKASENKITPLMTAISRGKFEVVIFLLAQEGIVVEAQDEDGYTAFHWACKNGYLAYAELLYQNNPTLLYKKDNNGQTGFYIAVWQGHLDVVTWLLKQDVNKKLLNEARNDKRTPLMAAALAEKLEVVRFLLAQEGIAVEAQDDEGYTAFHWFCWGGDLASVELIYQKNSAFLNQKDNNGQTGFYIACWKGHLNIVTWLLKQDVKKALLNEVKEDKTTPLMAAAISGRHEIVRFLLAQEGIDVEAQDKHEATAFDWACWGGNLVCVELIYQKNSAFLYQENIDGQTGFHVACREGHFEVVKWLLEKDVDKTLLNKVTKDKKTLLMEAALENKTDIVNFLLAQNGINVQAENIFGNTAFFFACRLGHASIIEPLYDKDPDSVNHINHFNITCLMAACIGGDSEIVKFLLDKKASLWNSDIWSMTAFDYALFNENEEVLNIFLAFFSGDVECNSGVIYILSLLNRNFLLEKFNLHISINQSIKNKALLIALSYFSFIIWSGDKAEIHMSLIKELLSKGAEVNCQDSQGNTPLLLAIRFGLNNPDVGRSIIQLLLDSGAFLGHKNVKGEGVLELAQENGDPELIAFMQEKYTISQQQSLQPTLFGYNYGSAVQAAAPLAVEAVSFAGENASISTATAVETTAEAKDPALEASSLAMNH